MIQCVVFAVGPLHYRVHLASTWRHSRDGWDQAFPVFHALLLLCIILNANRRTKNKGGLGTRLVWGLVFAKLWWYIHEADKLHKYHHIVMNMLTSKTHNFYLPEAEYKEPRLAVKRVELHHAENWQFLEGLCFCASLSTLTASYYCLTHLQYVVSAEFALCDFTKLVPRSLPDFFWMGGGRRRRESERKSWKW